MVTYKDAGVNIDAGNEGVARIKKYVRSTYTPGVINDIGLFGGLFSLKELLTEYPDPVTVHSVDSVGTKIMIASMLQKYDTVGIDMVAHSCNDILCQGAKPLVFLDYLAFNHVEPAQVEALVAGMSLACKENGVALVGGEIAELPGVYSDKEFDLVGSIMGIVNRDKIIDGKTIKPGDVVIGLGSSGLQTNGYSLARKVFFDLAGLTATDTVDGVGPIGPALLTPSLNYTRPVLELLKSVTVKGIAHITGGGLVENIPRILPAGASIELARGSWPVLPIFQKIQELGDVPEADVYRTLNMGLGLVLVVAPDDLQKSLEVLQKYSWLKVYTVGQVVAGERKVKLV